MSAAPGNGPEENDGKRRSSEADDNDEDPLVIDEEKPAEEEEGNEEDNEKEFEPTVDMIMNEFDDERTIEEEEALGQEDEAEELNALQNEQDIPIEELLKLYGYNNSQKDANEKAANLEVETKADSDQEDIAEPDAEVLAVPEQEVDMQKGEKRSSSTPPPSKKARSELAKFYEATVEGRSLRSSAGAPEDEEEESCEEEAEEGKDYSWKKTIMIGPTYQASVPGGLCSYDDTPPYENEDKQLWDPTRLSEEVSREYLAKSAETQGASGALGVNGIPTGSHIRDDEQALLLLLQCGYNTEEALRRKRMNAVPPADTMSLWSEEECRAFETGLRVYGKDFHSIQSQKVGTRSVGELVQFYYLWKKTERHDVFANSFRIEKKKYTLHPGTTDYMERFMDEQEVGRDRSASPNYHSLIYGDTRKKTDSRSESLSNGSNERSEPGSEPGGAGCQAQEVAEGGHAMSGLEPGIM
eukprot:GFUD01018887.1.p1 GENE.GFUD01018887.1~~GFUD01018887.1.p1  ORF type:complete len:469 (+),score=168.71 GFUD01018887.1:375-1781(+)